LKLWISMSLIKCSEKFLHYLWGIETI